MPLSHPLIPEQRPTSSDPQITPKVETEKILCAHCQRTATNGIKCQGICVADSDY